MIDTYTFIQLSKISKKDTSEFSKYRLALLGDCATQHLAVALKGYAYTRQLSFDILDGGYNQIMPQIIDTNSDMYAFMPDAILVFMCVENLYSIWSETPVNERSGFAVKVFSDIQNYWKCISANSSTVILQFSFAEYDDLVFGNYACKNSLSFIFQLRKLNFLLMEKSTENKNVYIIDLCGIQNQIGRTKLFDSKLFYIAKMPISLAVLPLVAASVVNVIQSLRGIVKKCVVLDLDNTLWGGVIGEDGLAGIQIGELGTGRAFSEFQVWLKELKKRGILLAVCSKNDETTAKEPFKKHNEMVLKLEDFSVFIANWDDKASNIRRIQKILNIGIDSFVFIDDSPFERDLVRSLIHEITVPELPEDPAEYLTHLQSLNLFETASYSDVDSNRTEQYKAEAQREILQQQYTNFDEYLQSLEMTSVAAPFDEFHIPRIAQLTQRSNQFNLRTIRYTETEINSLLKDPNRITFYFTLKDKLADYGLISVVILEKKDNKNLFIETWLMSCRVLKRGMEEFVINKIIETARNMKYKTIIGEYIRTQKNDIVANIYEKFNFSKISDNNYFVDVKDFLFMKTFIKEKQL
jgi:FkbH-like protein